MHKNQHTLMKLFLNILFLFMGITVLQAQQNYNEITADSAFTFKDSRDGKEYEALSYAGMIWMGENLRYNTKHSWCYEDKAGNCKEFGRLYTWEEAKSACPKGWHLPSKHEWDTLITALGGYETAGHALAFGANLQFNIVFGYPPNVSGRYSSDDLQASFWSADENNASTAWVYYFIRDKLPLVYANYFSKNYGMMCRCVMDEGTK